MVIFAKIELDVKHSWQIGDDAWSFVEAVWLCMLLRFEVLIDDASIGCFVDQWHKYIYRIIQARVC